MARRLLLRGNWGRPIAAIFLFAALSADLYATRAYGEEDGLLTNLPATDGIGSGEKKKSEEDNAPTGDAAKVPPPPAETKDVKAEPPAPEKKPPSVKPAEVKPTEVKPTEVKPGGSRDTRAEKPKDTDVKPGGSRDTRAEKPKDTEVKPGGSREMRAEKPRDLAPKGDEPGDLAVHASTVDALYHISWLGAYIGDFKIKSSITARQYSLQANADISVFFGTFTWQGVTSSSGLMTSSGPVPQTYTFRYATSSRRESVELRFQQRMVQDILINPPQHPGARNVPITAAHLQNVVDPLSAILLLSQARIGRGDACNKRLPIFDGKIRYDLVLSPKGTRTIGSSGKLHGTAYVCSVRYVPIAGHKMGRQGENDYATGNTGIEVWLVPLPEAGLIVPYYVHVPTPAGTASMVTAKFDVQTPAGRHALAE
jgi:hypothetical protein